MASLKARIESRLGVRLSERFWACLVKEFGENPSDYDGQDDYLEYRGWMKWNWCE